MNDSAGHESVELEVANFGPIVKAKIDLRPLTVFVGPSNTGKSYLAILIYALHRFFGRMREKAFFGFEEGSMEWRPPRNTIYAVQGWVQKTLAAKRDGGSFVLPHYAIDGIRSTFDTQGDHLGHQISRSFGVNETGMLIRKGSKDDASVILRKHASDDSGPFEHRLTLKEKGVALGTSVPEDIPVQVGHGPHKVDIGVAPWGFLITNILKNFVDPDSPPRRDVEVQGEFVRQLLVLLAARSIPRLVDPLSRPAFYLPADRTGVMHAHNVVVSAIIGNAPMTGLRPIAGTPMLSGVLADFLQQLIALDRLPPNRWARSRDGPRTTDPATAVEEAILGGAVSVEGSETIGYPRFVYRPSGWKDPLPLTNASSMVSELTPVVLYLRHLVGPGNVLIIEEPESHLHPGLQVEFTRQIAALVHKGVRVIMTTHSEWVLEELANIVRRSELPESERKTMPRGDLALGPDQVGAWLFKPKFRPRGSVVNEIHLDDSGLYPSEYDKVATALHNDWAEISSLLGEVR